RNGTVRVIRWRRARAPSHAASFCIQDRRKFLSIHDAGDWRSARATLRERRSRSRRSPQNLEWSLTLPGHLEVWTSGLAWSRLAREVGLLAPAPAAKAANR